MTGGGSAGSSGGSAKQADKPKKPAVKTGAGSNLNMKGFLFIMKAV
jgi:hypothetical protein